MVCVAEAQCRWGAMHSQHGVLFNLLHLRHLVDLVVVARWVVSWPVLVAEGLKHDFGHKSHPAVPVE